MAKITKWIWHKEQKTSKKVRARRLADNNTIEYQYDQDLKYAFLSGKVVCNKSYKTTVAKFYDQFESINMTRKCLDCDRYSGWKFYCKNCKQKRQEALNEIASEVISSL